MTADRLNYARWLIARSDIEVALSLLSQPLDDREQGLLDYIHKYWPHLVSQEAYQAIYREAGEIEAKVTSAFSEVPKQPRFPLIAWVMQNIDGCERVLDYGCSRGIWDIHLHNKFGKQWSLYDIDAVSIAEAEKLVRQNAKDPWAFDFNVVETGNPCDLTSWNSRHFDCALLLEVLEHVRDPIALLSTVEERVRPGGAMIVSVPRGPMEYSMWVEHPERRREHIREITIEDLDELLAPKQGYYLQYAHYGPEKYTGMGLGHIVVAWRKMGGGFGQIDLNRKLQIRRVPKVILPGFDPI